MQRIFAVILALGAGSPAFAVGSGDSGSPGQGASMAELAAQLDYAGMLALAEAEGDAAGADTLNYKGYALRKLGRVEEAIAAYRAALALEPDLHAARAYLGQGYLDQGNVEAARTELLEIRARGGRGSLAYVTLKNAILEKTGY